MVTFFLGSCHCSGRKLLVLVPEVFRVHMGGHEGVFHHALSSGQPAFQTVGHTGVILAGALLGSEAGALSLLPLLQLTSLHLHIVFHHCSQQDTYFILSERSRFQYAIVCYIGMLYKNAIQAYSIDKYAIVSGVNGFSFNILIGVIYIFLLFSNFSHKHEHFIHSIVYLHSYIYTLSCSTINSFTQSFYCLLRFSSYLQFRPYKTL